MVSHIKHLHEESGMKLTVLLNHIALNKKKYHEWVKRTGKPNHHNGKIPKEHWLTPEEVSAIVAYAKAHYADNDYFIKDGYRRLTYIMMDENIAAASPSSVYRILKSENLLNKWNTGKQNKKGTGFMQPDAPHKHWHTDIKYINFNGTFLFLISVLDGYSRYILHHEVRTHMTEHDVQLTLQLAKEKYPEAKGKIITDNGAQFIAKEFKFFVQQLELIHIKTSVAYPQSNGKIERFHRTISHECLRVKSNPTLADLKKMIAEYIKHYNTSRLHGALHYLTPEDYLLGRKEQRLKTRENKLMAAEQLRARYWAEKLKAA